MIRLLLSSTVAILLAACSGKEYYVSDGKKEGGLAEFGNGGAKQSKLQDNALTRTVIGVMSHRAYDSKKGAWYYEVNELATGSVVRFWHQKKIMYLRDKVALKFIQYRKRVQVKSITLLEREYYANHVKPSKRHRFNHSSVVERTIE